MKRQFIFGTSVVAILGLGLSLVRNAPAQTQSPSTSTVHKEQLMSTHASGTFDVKIIPQTSTEFETAVALSRFTIDKQFHGELEGTSQGEMLTAGDPKSAAYYVALERVTGTLNGRTGSFLFQHSASMSPTSQQLSVTVAPESGTGQLIGLAGKMNIKIVDKKHFYEFEYSLPGEN